MGDHQVFAWANLSLFIAILLALTGCLSTTNTPPTDMVYLTYSPKQCDSLPWVQWFNKLNSCQKTGDVCVDMDIYDEKIVKNYLESELHIKVYAVEKIVLEASYCQACNCPTGIRFRVQTNEQGAGLLESLSSQQWVREITSSTPN